MRLSPGIMSLSALSLFAAPGRTVMPSPLDFSLMGIMKPTRRHGEFGPRQHRPSESKYMPHTGAKEKARAARLFHTHPIYIHLATNHPGPEFARAEIRRMDRRQRKKEKRERETSAAAARKRWPLIRQQQREDRAAGRAS